MRECDHNDNDDYEQELKNESEKIFKLSIHNIIGGLLMKCKNCKFFKYDSEYKELGDCSKIFAEFIHISYADAWFVEPEFGCIYGEPQI